MESHDNIDEKKSDSTSDTSSEMSDVQTKVQAETDVQTKEPDEPASSDKLDQAEAADQADNVAQPASEELLDKTSQPFEGRWNRLISTTNWEKGQIIFEWRTALEKTEAPATEFSDEAWARRVGGVTGQHIGRLRRVFERFGENHTQYEGLYWSHFQAAIDWEDAEMWLEGSIQNQWSVSKMRKSRWEALGAPDDLKPREEDIITSELNEDLDTREDRVPQVGSEMSQIGDPGEASPSVAGPDFGDEDEAPPFSIGNEDSGPQIGAEDDTTGPAARPFENIPDLPDDVGDAFESFKLSIIRHKTNDWAEIARDDMLSALDSLKELTMAPATASPA